MEMNLLDDTPINSAPQGGNRNYNDHKPFKSYNQDNKFGSRGGHRGFNN